MMRATGKFVTRKFVESEIPYKKYMSSIYPTKHGSRVIAISNIQIYNNMWSELKCVKNIRS